MRVVEVDGGLRMGSRLHRAEGVRRSGIPHTEALSAMQW